MLNMLKTVVLLSLLGGLCVVAGGLIGQQVGLVIGLVLGLLIMGGSYWFSDKIAIASARARPVTLAEMPRYHEIMHELCSKADMPMPALYVSPNPQPNAFATGRNPRHAAVCVTAGLIEVMDWDEMRGVLAHELCHIRNRDVLICSVAAAVGMAITFVASMAMWMGRSYGGRSRSGSLQELAGRLVFALLAPLAAALIQAALSRSREYQADASAAKLMGTGRPLARALRILEAGAERIPSEVNPNQASAYIVNPLKARAAGTALKRLYSTHPPMEERIRRLESV